MARLSLGSFLFRNIAKSIAIDFATHPRPETIKQILDQRSEKIRPAGGAASHMVLPASRHSWRLALAKASAAPTRRQRRQQLLA